MVHFTCITLLLTLSSSVTVAQTSSTSFASILASDPNLSTLSAATANLTFTNISADANTLFAPTNDAFAKLDAAVIGKLFLPNWIAHLNNVLLMHVVEKELLSTVLSDGDTVTAINGESILVSIAANGTLSVSSPNTHTSVVSAADITGDEGVLHQVDSVLLPSFVTTDLLSLAGSDSRFTIITELLQLSGLDIVVGVNTTATVFAPTDEAFKALGDDALAYYRSEKAATTTLISGHVITPVVVPTQLMVNGMSIGDTPSGETLTATVATATDGSTVYMVNNATIVNPNVLAINGIIHALDSVLVVPGAEYPPVHSSTPFPTVSPTNPPVVTNPVDSTISGIQVRFSGIGTIGGTDILRLKSEMEQWFTVYFNQEEEASPRSLRQVPRMLQLRVTDVRNMTTVYDVTGQDLSSSGENTVTYTQSLLYDATADALMPEYYTLLPFVDSPYKELLLQRLSNSSNSFTSLSAIATPVVPVDSGGFSLAAIIGLSAVGVLGLLLLVCGALGSRRRRKDGDTGSHEQNDTTNHREDAGIIYNEVSEPHIGHVIDRNNSDGETMHVPLGLVVELPESETIHIPSHLVVEVRPQTDYRIPVSQKDQCRSVVGDQNRMVNAVAVQNSDKSTA
jgi:uncharacterized surface protein with fasciclin (FAS1) repeats